MTKTFKLTKNREEEVQRLLLFEDFEKIVFTGEDLEYIESGYLTKKDKKWIDKN